MASKENQEALEVVKSYLRKDNAYVVTITGEAVKRLQKAIDDLAMKDEIIKHLACMYVNATNKDVEYLSTEAKDNMINGLIEKVIKDIENNANTTN